MKFRALILPFLAVLAALALSACAPASTPPGAPTAPAGSSTPSQVVERVVVTPVATLAATPKPHGSIDSPLAYIGALPEGAVARLGQGRATAVKASPDNLLVAVGMTTSVLVYDAQTLDLAWSQPTPEGVSALAWSPDSSLVGAGLLSGDVIVWDGATGDKAFTVDPVEGFITALDWTADGAYLLSTGSRGISVVSDGHNGQRFHSLEYHEITDDIDYETPIVDVDAVVSPNGRRYATHYTFEGDDGGRPGGTIAIWDIPSGSAIHILEAGDRTSIASVAWSPDSQFVVNGSDLSDFMGLWNVFTGKLVESYWVGGTGFRPAWSPDGSKILAIAPGKTSVLMDVANMDWLAWYAEPPAGSEFLGWTSGGTRVEFFDGASGVITLNPSTGERVAPSDTDQSRHFLLTGDPRADVDVWDAAAGAIVERLVSGTPWISRVAWSPDRDNPSEPLQPGDFFWDAIPGGPSLAIHYYESPGYWLGGCVQAYFMPGDRDLARDSCPSDRIESPDGSLLAIAYNSDNRDLSGEEQAGVISIHDYKSGERLMVLRGHGSFITSMAFSPDGKLLATGSDDGTVILWEMAQ